MKTKVSISLFLFVWLASTICSEAQSPSKDLELIFASQKTHAEVPYNPPFMFVSKNKILRYNPISLAFGGLMYFYQHVVSPQISAECPYEISCSNFSKVSIQRYGLIKGIALTSGRMMRCCKVASVDINPLYIDEKGKLIEDPEQFTLK